MTLWQVAGIVLLVQAAEVALLATLLLWLRPAVLHANQAAHYEQENER